MKPRPILPAVALVVDLVLVLVFAAIGRASHDEDASVLGFLVTAWPFVAGLALGWIAVAIISASRPAADGAATASPTARPAADGAATASPTARRPLSLMVSGLVVWFGTVAAGLVIRAASGQGIAVSFAIVTAIVLAVFLLGWRALLLLVRRLRAPRPAAR